MSVDSFKGFLIDEKDGNKKRKKIASLIKRVVKKNLVSFEEFDDTTFIKFIPTSKQIKETVYEVVITIDYLKQFARGMKRAVYITIVRETNSYRDSDYLTIDVNYITDGDFMRSIKFIEDHFKKIIKNS